MSANGYETPHPSSFSRYEPRRSSGNISATYDRSPNQVYPHKSPPSPGPPRRFYDRYVPPRSDIPFRESLPNVYRPNNYRPDYSNANYYSRSPSPDSYNQRSRLSDSDVWDRGPWRDRQSPNVWSDRDNYPPSPTTSSRGRNLRDEPSSRIFEPSDNWKQSHVDRPRRDSSADRYYNRRRRSSLDASPDRLIRTDRPFLPSRLPKRDSYPARGDSYRPNYDNVRGVLPRRDPVSPRISPASSHYRRDSETHTRGRTSDCLDSPHSNRTLSGKPSLSPRPDLWSYTEKNKPPWVSSGSSPIWSDPKNPWTYSDVGSSGRVPSDRSSIASTHVSDRRSPVVSPPLDLIVTEGKSNFIDPNKSGAEPEPEPVISSSDSKKSVNGDLHQAVNSVVEISSEIGTYVAETSIDVSSSSNDISHVKQILNDKYKSNTATKLSKDIVASAADNVTSNFGPNGVSVALPELPKISIQSPGRGTPPSENEQHVVEIQQPKPSYITITKPLQSSNTPDIDIPPPTHSPIVSSPSPNNANAVPRPEQIPEFSNATSTRDAVRIAVMRGMINENVSSERRVSPILRMNNYIAPPREAYSTTPSDLINEMFSGQQLKSRTDSFQVTRPLLRLYLEQRHRMVENKVSRLREEYLYLQDKWTAHCHALNEQQKTLATEHEMQHTGRTTRRSTAITDAVRSDFEMEQIIASLGNDDATDPNHLSMSNLARIPDMISVTNGQIDYFFDDTSFAVENPSKYYAPNTGIDDWTPEEKKTFLDKFAAYPKQFGIIADFLENKSASQCVDYYYLHKKQFIDFRKIVSQYAPNKRKRRGMGRKKGNGLLADIAMHDMEVHRGSGTPTPAPTTRLPRGRKPLAISEVKRPALRRNAILFEDTPTSTPTPEPESRPRRRRPAANTPTMSVAPASSLSSVLPSTFNFASVPPTTAPTPPISAPPILQSTLLILGEDNGLDKDLENRPMKRAKRTRRIKSAATVSDEAGSDTGRASPVNVGETNDANSRARKEKGQASAVYWSEEDKTQFLSLLAQYGDDFKRIAASMPNKTTVQVSNYYKNNETALGLEKVAAQAPKKSPTPEQRIWKELPFPGSGVIAPDPAAKRTAAHPYNSSLKAPPPMSSLSTSRSQPVPPFPSSSRQHVDGAPQVVAPPYSTHATQRYPILNRSGVNQRPLVYSPPSRNAFLPFHPATEGPVQSKRTDAVHIPTCHHDSLPVNQTRGYLSVPYPPPVPTRPGYVPPPAVGPNAPSIVHSPTGLISPKPQPAQPIPFLPHPRPVDPSELHSYYPHSPPPGFPMNNTYSPSTNRYIIHPDGTVPADGNYLKRDNPYPLYPNMAYGYHQPPYPPSPSSTARPGTYYYPWTS